ncbi:ATP-binding cassette domain-containing protein [Kocuria sp. CPCC 205292]|uniref:metal ABC transporter ATP-binding protein n=1 Tax=Kocuria cellulosilytica TaxID=3071451 RepID=UPI0034D7A76C
MKRSSTPPAAAPADPAAIRTADLAVVLGAAPVLRGVDLTVADGEAVALMGGNGSGKSTLIKALLGIVPVASGEARLFGADVTGARRHVPWSRIGYVPQRVGVGAGVPATALEVVASGLTGHRRLRLGAGARRVCLDALEQVGLADRARESVAIFSGGQQQRVLIARALVRQPRLLLLDEPLSGVDQVSKEAIARILAQLQAGGTTLLVVLHELGELSPLLDRAVVLRHGRIVHDGIPPLPAPGHDAPDHEHLHPHGDAPAAVPAAPDLHGKPQ